MSELGPDELVEPAVRTTVEALGLGPEFAGLAALAVRVAAEIDAKADREHALRTLGPRLLRCLDALGATPMSRARMGANQRSTGR